ncbi:hypothetical protein BN1708_000896 [Verticillium longisporum]|uniref:Histidinol-phosphatase n=1 Tax=Verticillium longisporum TaxID=100787 RepID=A0A0G4M7Z7_VERLO|nr:hypothetical protein BN1708_000896 [Verticillium longisporum]
MFRTYHLSTYTYLPTVPTLSRYLTSLGNFVFTCACARYRCHDHQPRRCLPPRTSFSPPSSSASSVTRRWNRARFLPPANMAFTMHSHSGQFCPGHAKDQLEDIIRHAISVGYKTMGLTEHMPRLQVSDLYPEELTGDPDEAVAVLTPRHEAYLIEARRLQAKYASQIHVLIGFEGEWYRSAYGPYIATLAAHPAVDYFIGSIHHVNAIPIDYDAATYAQARESSGGTEERMYERYYDQQHEMLTALRPRVVGHFDLIRLLSEDPGRDVSTWAGVWQRIVRNLELVRSFDGLLECNSAALRKGLAEPYPNRLISEKWLSMGGRFTFSDDSHGIDQVATNYLRNIDYLESLGVSTVYTLERLTPAASSTAGTKATVAEKPVSLSTFRETLALG